MAHPVVDLQLFEVEYASSSRRSVPRWIGVGSMWEEGPVGWDSADDQIRTVADFRKETAATTGDKHERRQETKLTLADQGR